MKATVLDEPPLEFDGGGRHVDPRHGVADYGPADAANPKTRTIRVGLVGPPRALDGLGRWLDERAGPLEAKDSRLGHLFVAWPGFGPDAGYRSELIRDPRLERPVRERDLHALAGLPAERAVPEAVRLYLEEIAALSEEPGCDVVVVARPDDLGERLDTDDPRTDDDARAHAGSPNFRAELKAAAMGYRQPLQIVRRSTWDPTWTPPGGEHRQRQDEATIAWNLFTAIYYKAGGVPWRLPRNSTDLTTCYVGVSFYATPDRLSLRTSVAQVFNQRGDGVVLRGGDAKVSRDDRQAHLTGEDAETLLRDALAKYRAEHRTNPARVVMHKTSSYTVAEVAGFRAAAATSGLDLLELVWVPDRDPVRVFRGGEHSPLRGTLLTVDTDRHVLYTRGSVPFYGVYPGQYVPRPLPFRPLGTESSPEALAAEILALTKMNWNQTQLDGRLPITLESAENVGDVLKHLAEGVPPQGRYAYYM